MTDGNFGPEIRLSQNSMRAIADEHARMLKVSGMPNQPKTPQRTIRISDTLWAKAKRRADERGETLTEAIRKFLERYVR